MNKTIRLLDIVNETVSNSEGLKLFNIIDSYFKQDYVVYLSLIDCNPVSTSFFNSSFGKLIDEYGISYVKSKLKLTDYKMTEALRIKSYFERYNKLLQSV